VQIGVPVIMRQQPPTSLAFQQDGSVDSVVSVKSLAPLSEQQRGQCINVGAAAAVRSAAA
jgi:hypothetical protein